MNEPNVAEEILGEIQKSNELCQKLLEVVEDKKEILKEAKLEYDDAMFSLMETISESKITHPLFDQAKLDVEIEAIEEKAVAADEPADESWLRLKLSECLDLPTYILDGLEAKQIVTMGDLSRFQKKKELDSIPKFGKSRVKKVEEAVEKFWEDYQPPEDAGDATVADRPMSSLPTISSGTVEIEIVDDPDEVVAEPTSEMELDYASL